MFEWSVPATIKEVSQLILCVCVCVRALESKECESKKLGVLCLLSVGKDRGILEGSLTSLSLCLSCSDTFLWCIMVKLN